MNKPKRTSKSRLKRWSQEPSRSPGILDRILYSNSMQKLVDYITGVGATLIGLFFIMGTIYVVFKFLAGLMGFQV